VPGLGFGVWGLGFRLMVSSHGAPILSL